MASLTGRAPFWQENTSFFLWKIVEEIYFQQLWKVFHVATVSGGSLKLCTASCFICSTIAVLVFLIVTKISYLFFGVFQYYIFQDEKCRICKSYVRSIIFSSYLEHINFKNKVRFNLIWAFSLLFHLCLPYQRVYRSQRFTYDVHKFCSWSSLLDFLQKC